MQVAVIGGGVAGVCTAYFLAHAGHEVVVVERQTNVAEGASFGSAGPLSPVHALPWSAPGMPRKLLPMLLKAEAPVWIAPRVNRPLWRWARRWMAESEITRHQINRERAFRLASYSQETMRLLQQEHGFEFEQTEGHLRLYRSAREREHAGDLHAFLAEHDVPHQVLEPEEVWQSEPGLNRAAPLAGALSLPQDASGNCPLFCKQLRNAAQALGVHFHFGSQVDAVEATHNPGASLILHMGESRFPVDAAVVAAGAGSEGLLARLGVRLPFYPVRTYAATAAIRNFDDAPLASLADPAYQVAITRMGTRIRLAGTAELGNRSEDMRAAAIQTLLKAGQDWFPDAANYNAATLWSGNLPTLPDGPPILGATPVRNLYLNIGHAANSWAMAAGSGRILADLISGQAPDIDIDGLTLSRYG
jgi:D-amino-acid dehydrogenase